MAAGNGGQKMSQYSWFTVYEKAKSLYSQLSGAERERIASALEYFHQMISGSSLNWALKLLVIRGKSKRHMPRN